MVMNHKVQEAREILRRLELRLEQYRIYAQGLAADLARHEYPRVDRLAKDVEMQRRYCALLEAGGNDVEAPRDVA